MENKTLFFLFIFLLVLSIGIVLASVYIPVVNFPANTTKVNTHYALLNFTANGSVLVFANDNISRLNTKNGLVYINSSQLNKTMTYNLTTLPIQSDSDGLVVLYHFDNRSEFDESDTKVFDFSEDVFIDNGTCTKCPNWIEGGKMGGTFDFNGTNEFMQIDDFSLNITNGTIMAWFNTKGFTGDHQMIVWGGESGANGFGTETEIHIGIFKEGSIYQTAGFIKDTASDTCDIDEGTTLVENRWYHIVMTWDNSTCTLYTDGQVTALDTYDGNELSGYLTYTYIGRPSANERYFNGSIDEVGIWNRTLNKKEIMQIYQLKKDTFYWKVNATDISSNSNESGTYQFDVKPNASLTINFSETIGDIRSNFYGVNTHGIWGSNQSWIDINADGTTETLSNFTFHRDALTGANIGYIRADMSFENVANEDGTFKTDDQENYDNINTRANLVRWASENNIKVLFIAGFMPSWLNDTSNGCISNPSRCPPTNYSRWGDLVVDFIDNVTQNGLYNSTIEIEIWNEPDVAKAWLPDYALTNINRSIFYNKLYNATYNATKTKYPNIQVGGSATTGRDASTELIMLNWMSNFTNQIDFVSHHTYLAQTRFSYYDDLLNDDYEWIFNNISSRGVNTDRIIISEYNVWSFNTKVNNPIEHKLEIALAYAGTLNTYPANITLVQYQWAEDVNYSAGSGIYSEYPQRWTMVAEPKLENEFYISYNVTKNFATYHSTGSTIVNSTSDNGDVRVVSSKKGNNMFITIINTDSEAVNVTLNLDQHVELTNVKTGIVYRSLNKIVQIGNLDGYEVMHLEGETLYITSTVFNFTIGWNLVPQINTTNITFSDIRDFIGINTSYLSYWNHTNQSFITYPNGSGINNDFVVPTGYSYYAYAVYNFTKILDYTYTLRDYNLTTGWNVLFAKYDINISYVNSSIGINASAISYWNNTNKLFYTAVPRFSVRMSQAIPNLESFWIYIKNKTVWRR